MSSTQKHQGNPVMKRTYICLKGCLASPLLVGSGEDEKTDKDVILDGRGKPFVPGSSLAGALRHYLSDLTGDPELVTYWFGSGDERQSRLLVYDMRLEKAKLGHRDGVRLGVYKTAADMGKYDMQIVEPGIQYVIRLELVKRANDEVQEEMEKRTEEELLQKLVGGLMTGGLTLGAKSRRGFGKLTVEKAWRKAFNVADREGCAQWLDWDWGKDDAFEDTDAWSLEKINRQDARDHCLEVPLSLRQSLMIRQYTQMRFDAPNLPDYEQLKSLSKPVIPGSSWMGAIRERIRSIMEVEMGIRTEEAQKKLEPLFGTWGGELKAGTLWASKVRVEESLVESPSTQTGQGVNYQDLTLTRNAIDRFTGGTVRGALYTSKPWVGGQTKLILRWPRKLEEPLPKVIGGLLLWAIEDLQAGLLAVGGETAVGRGTFESNGQMLLDGEPLGDKSPYYKAAVQWCKEPVEKEGKGK